MYSTRPTFRFNDSSTQGAKMQSTKSNHSTIEREKRLERLRNEESVYIRIAQGRRNSDDGIRWLG